MSNRKKEIKRHLSAEDLDEAINKAQRADEARLVRRLTCIKNLYAGDTLKEAAWRVGVDTSAVSRWTDDWNEDGVNGLRPSFGGGRPPKLSEHQRDRLKRVLAEYQPWTTTEIKLLIEEAFDVSYSERHVSRLLRKFGMNYSGPQPEAPNRPENTEEVLGGRLQEALAELTDDEDGELVTDGGVDVGILTKRGHSRWISAVGCGPRIPDPRKTPTENFEDAVIGFYVPNYASLVRCKPNVTKEPIAELFMRFREQNPAGRIPIVCENFSSHFANLVDHEVESFEITRVPPPRHSLHPIEVISGPVHRDHPSQICSKISRYLASSSDLRTRNTQYG